MRLETNRFAALAVAAALAGMWVALAQVPFATSSSRSTPDRLRSPGWWPTKGNATRKDYVGSEACAECHRTEVAAQLQTSMARAASKALETDLLRSTAKISLDSPPFLTTIVRDRKGSTYTAGRGGEAISGQVVWTMGDGTMGRTFVVDSSGSLFESQLSYFSAIGRLDLTPGHTGAAPRDLQGAFGQKMSEATAQRCFGCHTTASSIREQFDPAHATPGVTCEACHGPGGKHVAAMHENRIEDGKAAILNPAHFDPVTLVDYCGACHRTPLDVAAAKDFVPTNIRFQPYRLEKSRCWSRPDPRIACTACHNPHEQIVRDAAFYDAKCLACHASKTSTQATATAAVGEEGDMRNAVASVAALQPLAEKRPACPVATSHCASCHMPRYNVESMHGSFTDHDIRVVRPGSPYPM